ncbi:MAG: amidase [Dehalococcoidia bacterium]|nr:amidase [Dehalococcoidia bacterium]
MPETPMHYQTIAEIAPMLKAKKLSPVELTQSQFKRVRDLDGKLKAFAILMEESAMADAKSAEKEIVAGRYRGPLHGVPVGVKDLCYTKGVRTMGGTAALKDFIPQSDATVVTRLREAGAVIIGKLHLTEGAMASYNPALPCPFNPWDPKFSAGGSSSGSGVATASGMCFASLGTDTGGSIRFPSACNGIVGIKPTWGRVSRRGILDLAQSLDHVGPMTRSVADAAAVLQAIAGDDPQDPTTLTGPVPDFSPAAGQGVRGLKIGFDEQYVSDDVHPETARAVSGAVSAMEALGAQVVKVQVPDMRPYLGAWQTICTSEAFTAHSAHYPVDSVAYGPWFRSWLEHGSKVTGAQYAAATHARLQLNGLMRRVFDGIDVLACPSMGSIEQRKTDEQLYKATCDDWVPFRGRFTIPYNFSGQPTISLPAGFGTGGAPLSLQLIAKHGQEATLVRAGHSFEQATQHHTRHPGL